MYRDAQLEMSVAQVVTATAASTNVIDLTVAGDAVGGAPCYLVVRVGTAGTAGGAATVMVDLQTDSDVAFGTQTTLFSSGAIPVASLTANSWIVRVALPVGMKQFNRIYYTVATGPLLTGTFDAFITTNIDVRR